MNQGDEITVTFKSSMTDEEYEIAVHEIAKLKKGEQKQ